MSTSSSSKNVNADAKGGLGPSASSRHSAAAAAAAADKAAPHPNTQTRATRAKVENRIKFLQVDKDFFQEFEQKFLNFLPQAQRRTPTQIKFKEAIETFTQIEQEFAKSSEQAHCELLLKKCDDLHQVMDNCFQLVDAIIQQQLVPPSKNETDAEKQASLPAVQVAAYQIDPGEYSTANARLQCHRLRIANLNLQLNVFRQVFDTRRTEYAKLDPAEDHKNQPYTLAKMPMDENVKLAPNTIYIAVRNDMYNGKTIQYKVKKVGEYSSQECKVKEVGDLIGELREYNSHYILGFTWDDTTEPRSQVPKPIVVEVMRVFEQENNLQNLQKEPYLSAILTELADAKMIPHSPLDIVKHYREILVKQVNEIVQFAPISDISPEIDAQTILSFANTVPQVGIVYIESRYLSGNQVYTEPLRFVNDPFRRVIPGDRFAKAVVVPLTTLRSVTSGSGRIEHYVSEKMHPFQHLYTLKYVSRVCYELDSISVINPLFQELFRLLFADAVDATQIATEVNALIRTHLPPTRFVAVTPASTAAATAASHVAPQTPSTALVTVTKSPATMFGAASIPSIDSKRQVLDITTIQCDLTAFARQATDEGRLFLHSLLEVIQYSPKLNRQRLARGAALLAALRETQLVSAIWVPDLIDCIVEYTVGHVIMNLLRDHVLAPPAPSAEPGPSNSKLGR